MPKCLAKKHTGGFCQNSPIKGRDRCKFHGGMSLRGERHWNYQGKGYSKEDRARAKETNSQLRLLEMIAIELGMISKKR